MVKDKESLLNHNLLFEKKQFFYGYLRNCKKQLNWNGGRQVENLISLAYFLRVSSTTLLWDPKTWSVEKQHFQLANWYSE